MKPCKKALIKVVSEDELTRAEIFVGYFLEGTYLWSTYQQDSISDWRPEWWPDIKVQEGPEPGQQGLLYWNNLRKMGFILASMVRMEAKVSDRPKQTAFCTADSKCPIMKQTNRLVLVQSQSPSRKIMTYPIQRVRVVKTKGTTLSTKGPMLSPPVRAKILILKQTSQTPVIRRVGRHETALVPHHRKQRYIAPTVVEIWRTGPGNSKSKRHLKCLQVKLHQAKPAFDLLCRRFTQDLLDIFIIRVPWIDL